MKTLSATGKRRALSTDYQAEFADRQTYRYLQFCEHYKAFTKRLKRSMRQIHRAARRSSAFLRSPLCKTTGSRLTAYATATFQKRRRADQSRSPVVPQLETRSTNVSIGNIMLARPTNVGSPSTRGATRAEV